MLDEEVCDDERPPKWNSSLTLYKYIPEDEYQVYPGRKIVYLKLSATITGYQPQSDQIEGEVDWDDLSVESKEDFEEMLSSYLRCTGALLDVTVESPGDFDSEAGAFIMDFQPKRRAMYDMVSETNERMSRSLESLNIRKASGTTQSQEAIDIDMGGSVGVNLGVGSPEGGGGSIGYSESTKGQWGSRKLDSEEENRIQTADRSRERREGYSHTTQLSQVHHLFDSYHPGTNRASFFVLPRPYTKEEPTGFVRGPRGIDGIQDIFLVISQPEEQEEVCVSARMDTAHLSTLKNYDYRRVTATPQTLSVSTPLPTPEDENSKKTHRKNVDLTVAGHLKYDCYEREDVVPDQALFTWRPEENGYEGYIIDRTRGLGGYEIVDRSLSGPAASADVDIDQSGEFLTMRVKATSKACYYVGASVPSVLIIGEIPKIRDAQRGSASLSVKVYLRSRERTVEQPPTQSLVITTRGLCCCLNRGKSGFDGVIDAINLSEYGVRFEPAVDLLDNNRPESTRPRSIDPNVVAEMVAPRKGERAEEESADGRVTERATPERMLGLMSTQEANAMGGDFMRTVMLKSAGKRARRSAIRPASYLESTTTVEDLRGRLAQTRRGREYLDQPAVESSRELIRPLAKALDIAQKDLTRDQVVTMPSKAIAEVTEIEEGIVNRYKLRLLGVSVRIPEAYEPPREEERYDENEDESYNETDQPGEK